MALVVVQVPSMGAAYLSVSLFADSIYDMIPQGYGATLLVNADKEKVEAVLSASKVEFHVDGVLADGEEKILRSLYSIDNSALKESMLVIESISPGVLIRMGHLAVELGLEIVDLKIPRGSQVTGSVLVTGSEKLVKEFESNKILVQTKAQLTYVKVTGALEKFFDISPKN